MVAAGSIGPKRRKGKGCRADGVAPRAR